MWSRKHEACVVCGTTNHKHMAGGKCQRCYLKSYRGRQDPLAVKAYKAQWFQNDKKNNPEKYAKRREDRNHGGERQAVLERDGYRCRDCGRKLPKSRLVSHHKDMTGRGARVRLHGVQHEITLCRACHAMLHHNQRLSSRFKVPISQIHKWSVLYAKCVSCGTTAVRHNAKGLCANCYPKLHSKR